MGKKTGNENSDGHYASRITSNTILLFLRILVITVVNLYTVRLVLGGLGEEEYGVFNAVVGVVMTCSCVFPVLAISIQRFLSYVMGKGEHERMQAIFSASINIIVVSTVVIVLLLETIGVYVIENKMQIPQSIHGDTLLVFHFAMLTFVFSYLQIPFTAVLFSHEDMGTYAKISCLDCVLKLIVAIALGFVAARRLLIYGAGLSIVALCTLLCYAVVACRRYKECRYSKVTDFGLHRELLSFSGWTMYGAFAAVGMMQGNTILLNVYFGPLANAAFGVATNIYNAFTSLINSVVLSFRPRMIQLYAAKDKVALGKLFNANNLFIVSLVSCVAIPVMFEMRTIMHFWLKSGVSENMILFSRLFIVYALILAMHNPITVIMQASGKIKYYHLIVESVMVLSLPLTWMLFEFGLPAYTVFGSMILLCGVAHILRIVCLKYNYDGFSALQYVVNVLLRGGCAVVLSVAVAYVLHMVINGTLLRLFVMMVASPVATLVFIYLIGITKQEQAYVNRAVAKILRR